MLGIEVYSAISQIYTVHVHAELATSYSLRVPTPPAHRMAQELLWWFYTINFMSTMLLRSAVCGEFQSFYM